MEEIAKHETRGIRNNNPGNLRKTKDNWLGLSEEQTDRSFFQFKTMEYGVRALIITLGTYVNKYNLHSIDEIISRFAPSVENPTAHYIEVVKRLLDDLDVNWDYDYFLHEVTFGEKCPSSCLFFLCQAICEVESNFLLTFDLFCRAYKLI